MTTSTFAHNNDLESDEHFDLIVVGSGSGNSLPDDQFLDWKIAIIEEGRFGGTCLNVGCIPTKMYVKAADQALQTRTAHRLGVSAEVTEVDWPGIVTRVFDHRIDPISAGGESYRRGPETPNITVFDGHATFVGDKMLATAQGDTPRVISADHVVIAAGSRPEIPEVISSSGVRYRTNADIMRVEQLPESLIILGGGYIATEFAHVFDALGTEVTIVQRSEALLRQLDETISRRFNEVAEQRWDIHYNSVVTDLAYSEEVSSTGEKKVTATLSDGSQVTADEILVAVGRTANGDLIDAPRGGIALSGTRVEVDDFGRSTSAPGVWALGDVSSPYMLKHVANAEERTIQHNLLHPDDLQVLPHEAVPSAIFTAPEIATVGLTEAQARETGRPLTVKVQAFGDVAYGWALEDTTGLVKLIADRSTGELLGAHYLGPQASSLIQQMITVMALHIDLRGFARSQYWIHPALPEVTENALLGLDFD